MILADSRICIIGLGYVGLPLAIEFSKKFPVVGFDIDKDRISQLKQGIDLTLEVEREDLLQLAHIAFTDLISEIRACNVYIVTVPTPIDSNKKPDLTPLIKASQMLGEVISKGDTIIYESTVYPGATEEDCIPEVERLSGMKMNVDFFCGYSPERINPGDKQRRVSNILKVTSGSSEDASKFVDELYNTIIDAGTFRASSIRVAEASKVIENVQRDVNIALINELYQVFELMSIDTNEVIDAAATKWNFMKLKPGLVGGHCIGVDPYYLLHKSQVSGFIPDLIRTSREINDAMPSFISTKFLKSLIENKINPIDLKVCLLGFAFKENCPDFRNTKVYALYKNLESLGMKVSICDPIVDARLVKRECGVDVAGSVPDGMDVGFLSVPHDLFIEDIDRIEGNFKYKYIFDFRAANKTLRNNVVREV